MEEKSSDAKLEKIAQMLKKRPPKGQFREQLFWLVDMVYACKDSGDNILINEAKLMEKALGRLTEFMETGNTEALAVATKQMEQFARMVKTTVAGEKLKIFLSYSTQDTELFKIPEVASRLKEYPEISTVFYWEKDSGQDIVEYMEENIENSRVFILFCTQNSKMSKAVQLERRAALQLQQEEKIRLIPVFQDPSEIPLLFKSMLGVEFNSEDFDGFIGKLHKEILRR